MKKEDMKPVTIPIATLAQIYINLYNAEFHAGKHCLHSRTREKVGAILANASNRSIEPSDATDALFEHTKTGGSDPYPERQKTISIKSWLQPAPHGKTPLTGNAVIEFETLKKIYEELLGAWKIVGDKNCYHSWAVETLQEIICKEKSNEEDA